MPQNRDAILARADDVIGQSRARREEIMARINERRVNNGKKPIVLQPQNDAIATVDGLVDDVQNFKARHTRELRDIRRTVEARATRPYFLASAAIDDRRATKHAERSAFRAFLRGGRDNMKPDQINALRTDKGSEGGFLVPSEMNREMIRNLELISPIRSVARVSATTAAMVEFPKRTDNLNVYWNSELETRTPSEPKYGTVEIYCDEMATYVDVSRKLLEDSAFNLESELAIDFGQAFGQKEGNAFILGEGGKQPTGLLAASVDSPAVASGSAATLTFDSILDLLYALPSSYAANATFIMNRATMGVVRRLSDGLGRYLWQDDLVNGGPSKIAGVPVLEAPDMPNVGANAFPIIVGDFMMGYRVLDRLDTMIMRDDVTQATFGRVRFHARRRVGGGVVLAEAFRKLKIAVSL